MDVLLKIVGGLWASLGALNVVVSCSIDPADSTAMLFGLVFNMFLFILPGLAVYGIGASISKKKKTEQKNPGRSGDGARMRIGPFDELEAARRCPQCAETIKVRASICRFCNRQFTEHEIDISVSSARTEHEAKRTRQWLKQLPRKEQIMMIDAMAREGSARRWTSPFTSTYWKLTPVERNHRVSELKELPADKWVELVRTAKGNA